MSEQEENQFKENLESLESDVAVDKLTSAKQDTYTVIAACSNCDFSSAVQVAIGIEVREIKCPTCGCLTLFSRPVHIITIGKPVIRIGTKLS